MALIIRTDHNFHSIPVVFEDGDTIQSVLNRINEIHLALIFKNCKSFAYFESDQAQPEEWDEITPLERGSTLGQKKYVFLVGAEDKSGYMHSSYENLLDLGKAIFKNRDNSTPLEIPS